MLLVWLGRLGRLRPSDPSRAVKNGNNFVHLGRRLNTYIEFRHVREDLRTHAEAFCIADERALVYRLQANRWEGIADTHEPAVAMLYSKKHCNFSCVFIRAFSNGNCFTAI